MRLTATDHQPSIAAITPGTADPVLHRLPGNPADTDRAEAVDGERIRPRLLPEAAVATMAVASAVVDHAAVVVAVVHAAADANNFSHNLSMTTMKNYSGSIIILIMLLLSISFTAMAQYPEDVLRLSTPGVGVGARSFGLGMSYTGVANDFSALYWNPAGLGQLKMNEFSFGMSQLGYDNTGTLYNEGASFSNNSTNLNSLGLVYSIPTTQGSLVIALGYSRQSDFTTGLSFQGFNPKSSIIQNWAPDGAPLTPDVTIAEYLKLAYADTISQRFISPIHDSLTQNGTVIEGGGINNYSIGGGVEVGPNLFLGLSLNVLGGSYSYERNYGENDLLNYYQTFPYDFSSLSLLENVESDIGGFNAKVGLLYKYAPNSRIGVTIKTPSWISVHETFSQSASSTFDDGYHLTYDGGTGKDDYDVTTPFVFSVGASYAIQNLMLTGEVEYTDWTQMEFRNASADVMAYNTLIKSEFQPTANLHAGAEYELIPGSFQIRGGFAYLPSPYNGDPSDYAKKYITGGVSFALQNSIIIELGYAHGFWKNYRVNYDYSINNVQTARVDEDIKTNTILGTVSYRF